jgi:hypothetical protein
MYFRLQEADYLVSEQNNQENRSNLNKNYFFDEFTQYHR